MPEERKALAIGILRYLLRHPDAHDNIAGIAQWWLLEQEIHRTLGDVAAVLDELVEKGWVKKESSASGESFALNHSKEEEIIRFLHHSGGRIDQALGL